MSRKPSKTFNANSHNVEERRFSAASSLKDDADFCPCDRNLCQGKLSLRSPKTNTTRPNGTMSAALFLLALALASASLTLAQKTTLAVTADLPAGLMQAKATSACTECHEARIILQQRLSKAAWGKEVDKMTKWGAVVDPVDHDALVDYLSTNFSPEKAAYDPPRTSTASAKSK